MLDTSNMLDDSRLLSRKITVRSSPPLWTTCKIKRNDPLKKKGDRRHCRCCGRYCVFDFFKRDLHRAVVCNDVYKAGDCDISTMTFKELQRGMRNGAYKIFENYLRPLIGPPMTGWLNQCIVRNIKKWFPCPDRDYVGYKYTTKHMNLLIKAKKRRAAKEAEDNDLARFE